MKNKPVARVDHRRHELMGVTCRGTDYGWARFVGV